MQLIRPVRTSQCKLVKYVWVPKTSLPHSPWLKNSKPLFCVKGLCELSSSFGKVTWQEWLLQSVTINPPDVNYTRLQETGFHPPDLREFLQQERPETHHLIREEKFWYAGGKTVFFEAYCVYSEEYSWSNCKLLFAVVQKRINTRIVYPEL